MADPAVQARDEIIRAADHTLKNWELYDDDGHLWTAAEAVVAAVTPLIRRQAFTEAAELAQHTLAQGCDQWHIGYNRAGFDIAVAIRGLSEGTENGSR